MYVLLSGEFPFKGRNDNDILAQIRKADPPYTSKAWEGVSKEAIKLIKNMICKAPAKRYTAKKALNDSWVKVGLATYHKPLQESHLVALKAFVSEHKLKKVARSLVARHLGEAEIEDMRDIFMTLDTDGGGTLTIAEMHDGFAKSNLPEDALKAIMNAVDDDGSGEIDYTEFLAATLDRKFLIEENVCWSAFRVFDKDGDGHITPEELMAVLSEREFSHVMGEKDINEIMEKVDLDHNGYIDFQEFMTMMRG